MYINQSIFVCLRRIGLQSHSPNDQHLYACVGLDCNPRVQGTPGPSQKWVPQKKRKNKKTFVSIRSAKMGSAEKNRNFFFPPCFKCCRKILLK